MAEQLQGLFESSVDSPYSKKRPSPNLHKFPIRSNKLRTRLITRATTTLPPLLQLGVTVTAFLCIIAAHCRHSTKFSNGPRTFHIWRSFPLSTIQDASFCGDMCKKKKKKK